MFHVSDFPENTYFPKMLFSGKENIFKCLVAFQKMLWKIFSGVWLYGWKYYFPTNFSHGNSTHGSKLRQSKATTTKTPPPHHHNNNKNQNHTEIKITQRERLVGERSVGRRQDRTEARSKVRSARCNRRIGAREIEQRGVIVGLELTRSTGACDRRGLELARSTCACDWRRLELARSTGACDRRGLELGVCRQSSDWTGACDCLFFLSLSLSVRNSFEVKIGTEIHFRGQSVFFSVNWNWFPENSIFRTNQTPSFPEKHFWKWFSPKTNTP